MWLALVTESACLQHCAREGCLDASGSSMRLRYAWISTASWNANAGVDFDMRTDGEERAENCARCFCAMQM